jgi:hypothetical protein
LSGACFSSQAESWIAFDAKASFDRNATSAEQSLNSTVSASIALIWLISPV